MRLTPKRFAKLRIGGEPVTWVLLQTSMDHRFRAKSRSAKEPANSRYRGFQMLAGDFFPSTIHEWWNAGLPLVHQTTQAVHV